MAIYTRHGDKAETTTFDGIRVKKTAPTIAAYGDIDELTSHLGLLRALMTQTATKASLNYTDIALKQPILNTCSATSLPWDGAS